ncbi:MAG: cytochrome c3 family protein [Gammaproteobacteria bacterium]
MAERDGKQSFRFDQSVYERPLGNYRCGRGADWDTPCWQGPDAKGRCGGCSECTPIRKGDGWQCQRPKHAGGPCKEGPRPDGSCCKQQPPCTPVPTLRAWRGRISALVVVLILAALGVFANHGSQSGAGLLALEPGALSSVHAGFTREKGCTSCHEAHGGSATSWLASVFSDSDPSAQCQQCHAFEGPADAAHNNAEVHDGEGLACTLCHTEHQGEDADVAAVPDGTCANCHDPHIDRFEDNHPGFSEGFPHRRPGVIQFDHTTHISSYFSDPEWTGKPGRDAEFAERASQSCTVCHQVDGATREVLPRPYEQICGRCHDQQVAANPLFLFRPDEMTVAGAMVLGMHPEDADEDEYLERQAELFQSIVDEGPDPLAEPLAFGSEVDEDAPHPAVTLLSGMDMSMLVATFAAWAEEEEPEGPESELLPSSGWIGGYDPDGNQALHYRPSRHGDPVLKAWFETLSSLRAGADEERAEHATVALETLLDADSGPGSCAKCHRAGIARPEPSATGAVLWKRARLGTGGHTRYSHGPHLNLVDSGSGCTECHGINDEAAYSDYFDGVERDATDYASNFSPIAKDSCSRCHREGVVDNGCQLCHQYHRSPGFRKQFTDKGMPHVSNKE